MLSFENISRFIHTKTGKNIAPETLRAWWNGARPAYYIATLIPLFVGFVAAGNDMGQWRVGLFCIIVLACFFLHVVHFCKLCVYFFGINIKHFILRKFHTKVL